jgi:hypothetical protein
MKKLTNFIPPPTHPNSANKSKVDRFIKRFNEEIKNGKFSLNDGLDRDVEDLNDAERALAIDQAWNNGYILTIFEDNYNTTTYKLEINSFAQPKGI